MFSLEGSSMWLEKRGWEGKKEGKGSKRGIAMEASCLVFSWGEQGRACAGLDVLLGGVEHVAGEERLKGQRGREDEVGNRLERCARV
jgi:hypothetical protein